MLQARVSDVSLCSRFKEAKRDAATLNAER